MNVREPEPREKEKIVDWEADENGQDAQRVRSALDNAAVAVFEFWEGNDLQRGRYAVVLWPAGWTAAYRVAEVATRVDPVR